MSHVPLIPLGARRALPWILPVAVMLGSAGGLAAQERTTIPRDSSAEERCECIRIPTDLPEMFRSAMPGRARLGVYLDPRYEDAGVRVDSVASDGPAARAGLRAGDVITALNGRTIGPAEKRAGRTIDSPVSRIGRVLSDIEPGDTVTVSYRRGNDSRTAKLVTEESMQVVQRMFRRLEPTMERIANGDMFPDAEFQVFGGPGERHVTISTGGLELADVNEGLEPYFGTSTGALVLDPRHSFGLDLKAGDVILRIGDREVRGASQARRILASYDEGEQVRMDVMRQKKRITVSGKLER